MEILIISGLSGSGKSKAASFLEDIGFYIVDNMPAGMILKFAEFCAAGSSRYSRVALVYDVRTADNFDDFLDVLHTLREKEYQCKLLFLEADVRTIIKRYKETRRLHPLQEQAGTLEAAVNQEIQMMARSGNRRMWSSILPPTLLPDSVENWCAFLAGTRPAGR